MHLRFGHSQVNTHLWRYEENGTISSNGHLPMRDAYFAPERVKREGGIDPLFRGAVKQAAQEIDLKVRQDDRTCVPSVGSLRQGKQTKTGREFEGADGVDECEREILNVLVIPPDKIENHQVCLVVSEIQVSISPSVDYRKLRSCLPFSHGLQ